MINVPDKLREQLKAHGQEHLLTGWEELTDPQRQSFLGQIGLIRLDDLQDLYAQRDSTFVLPDASRVSPVPVARLDPSDRRTREIGEAALRRGEVAVLLVAGGQGSRLGFDHPKGMFPIGPVSNKPLFQIHVEKVLALGCRYGCALPLLVMTSPATHTETQSYFAEKSYFGLSASDVMFFCQGTMPAVDLATGRLLLEAPGRLFTSPDGHGGMLAALANSGLIGELDRRGIKHIFYFQVDNPLVRVADPLFLGHHLDKAAEASSKIIPKESPLDRLGNMVLIDGRCSIIEYSDLPRDWAEQTDETGRLRIWAGSPAIHIFALEFLKRLTDGPLHIPFHVARKKVSYLDPNGKMVEPSKENALKFEKFIFDVLPLAQRWTAVETSRREEFVPLKNATGADSPSHVRQALTNLAGDWLSTAGVEVPRTAEGDVSVALEISPLFALDAEEVQRKVPADLRITGPRYFV